MNQSVEQQSPPHVANATARSWSFRRFAPLAGIVLLVAFAFAMGWHREVTLENLVRHRAAIADFVDAHVFAALTVFVALYIAVVALSLPGATILTVSGGLLFGALAGGLAVIVGATIGATVIFLIARSAIGDVLARRAGPRIAALTEGFREDAFNYLLFLRLVPLFPFFLVNLAPAILGVRLAPFVIATAIGIIPGTFVYALVGAGFDSAIAGQVAAYKLCLAEARSACALDFDIRDALNAKLIGAFAGLGVVALLPVILKKWRRRRA